MGVVIYVDGEIETNANEAVMEKFLAIRDDFGEEAFRKADDGVISFCCDTMEGSYDPFTRCVYEPLTKLADIARENGASLEGCIEVSSDWSDYNNIYVDVSENGIETGNREIRDAGTDELVRELAKRGIRMDDLISRSSAITQLSHNRSKGDDEWGLAVSRDIQTIQELPPAYMQAGR